MTVSAVVINCGPIDLTETGLDRRGRRLVAVVVVVVVAAAAKSAQFGTAEPQSLGGRRTSTPSGLGIPQASNPGAERTLQSPECCEMKQHDYTASALLFSIRNRPLCIRYVFPATSGIEAGLEKKKDEPAAWWDLSCSVFWAMHRRAGIHLPPPYSSGPTPPTPPHTRTPSFC